MHSSYVSLLAAAGLATFAHAQDYTTPTEASWGPLLLPDLTHPVTQGEDFTVTWDPEDHPTDGVTVSLVLCKGPSTNCVTQDNAIATGLSAASKSYDWKVPCDLTPGTQATESGYGMLVIVDGTGEFQYSTQFSVLENKACSSSGGDSTTTSSSIVVGPSSGTHTWSGNSTHTLTTSWTGTGSWGGHATTTASDATYTSEATLSTIVDYTSGYTQSAGSTLASTSTTAPAPGSSTFDGAAGQLSWNAAGMVVAGAVALFAF